MTTHDILNLRKLLLEVKRKDDCDCLSVAELDGLLSVMNAKAYRAQLEDFRAYLMHCVPFDAPEDAWDDFYELDWEISFGGHRVTLHNDAIIYNAISDALDSLLDMMIN